MSELIASTSREARAAFHVLVKPIGPLCNLGCEYCFYLEKTELYRGSKFRMADSVLEAHVRDYIAAQPPACKEVNFAWQGGEPTLLGVEFFERAVELQRKHARPGMRITNALQTNGTRLDARWCTFLKDHDFLVGISIDGPAALHDRYRKTKGGRGTFEQVRRGLDCLREHGTEFNILCVVQRDNGDHPALVYENLKDMGGTHIQFIPIVERMVVGGDDAGVTERTVRPVQFGDFLVDVFEIWRAADIGEVFVQHFDTALGAVVGSGESLCVHARRCGRAVALEHNGDLYACDHFVFQDYLIGNVMKDGYADMLDGEQQTAFGEAKEKRLPPKCLRCSVRYMCNGGCPAHQFVPQKRGGFPLNYLCDGYLRFFKHAEPFLKAMGESLRHRLPAREYFRFMDPAKLGIGRNQPCPCGSGRKFKQCCWQRL